MRISVELDMVVCNYALLMPCVVFGNFEGHFLCNKTPI